MSQWVSSCATQKTKKEKKKRIVETHLKGLFDRSELPVGLLQLAPLQRKASPVLGRAGQGPAAAADYKQTKPQKLHVGVFKSVRRQVTGGFFLSKDLLEVHTVVSLTFLYLSRRRQENHSQGAGNLQKLARVTNKISFPLAVATTWSESGVTLLRVRGAACMRVNVTRRQVCERDRQEGPHFPFSLWISGARSRTVS